MPRFEVRGSQIGCAMSPELPNGENSLLSDALHGNGWSLKSIELLQKLFQLSATNENATALGCAGALHAMVAAVNQKVNPELERLTGRMPDPIGITSKRNFDGCFDYYMMLSKDLPTLRRNYEDLLAGRSSSTLIKIGTFLPRGF